MAPALSEQIKTDDWKKEKHVPVIDCPDRFTKDQVTQVKVTLGKEIAHPNTTEHHIRWISLFFQPEGGKFTYQVGHFEFTAHGESAEGPNKGPVYAHHEATASVKVSQTGTLYALAYCNIHGMWQSSKAVAVG